MKLFVRLYSYKRGITVNFFCRDYGLLSEFFLVFYESSWTWTFMGNLENAFLLITEMPRMQITTNDCILKKDGILHHQISNNCLMRIILWSNVCECVCKYLCKKERECVLCVCVCVWEREREIVCVREEERECVCVCVKEKERVWWTWMSSTAVFFAFFISSISFSPLTSLPWSQILR